MARALSHAITHLLPLTASFLLRKLDAQEFSARQEALSQLETQMKVRSNEGSTVTT
jgi:hypothetical protein